MKKILVVAGLFATSGVWAQHATGDNTSAAEFDAILKTADRTSRDFLNLPSSFSLKKYAPIPQNQGKNGTCVAWSSAYAARTISYAINKNMVNADSIKKYAFSPGYIYYKIKDADDTGCMNGTTILKAMKTMTATGVLLKKEGPVDCATTIPENTELQKASPYKIKDFLALNRTFDSITKNDIIKIKKSLTEKKPVLISMKIYDSFEKTSATGIWTPLEDDLKIPGSHAMCIIGYDDKMAGGSFEVINSWGESWGNKGFLWLPYKQVMKDGVYAVELMDFEAGRTELSGSLEFVKMVNGSFVPFTKVSRLRIDTSMTIVRTGGKANYSLYKLTEALKTGDEFKVNFTTNAPCYIYIFGEDSRKEISLLFPTDPTFSAAINSYNANLYLPDTLKHAVLNETTGKEIFCILYCKNAIDFEELKKYIDEKKINISQAVKDKLGARLLDINKITFSDNRITFKAPADDKSILCFFVEMKHN